MVISFSQNLLPASSSPISTLKMEAECSCEKLITAYEKIRCHKSEENNPNVQHYKSLKPQTKKSLNDDIGITLAYNINLQDKKKSVFILLSLFLY
jgi:hypothetical protein